MIKSKLKKSIHFFTSFNFHIISFLLNCQYFISFIRFIFEFLLFVKLIKILEAFRSSKFFLNYFVDLFNPNLWIQSRKKYKLGKNIKKQPLHFIISTIIIHKILINKGKNRKKTSCNPIFIKEPNLFPGKCYFYSKRFS